MPFVFATTAFARRSDAVAAAWQTRVVETVAMKRDFRDVEDTTGTGGSKR